MTATKKPREATAALTPPECHQIALALNLLTTLRAACGGFDPEEERAERQSALAKIIGVMNAHRDLVRDDAGNVVARITRSGGGS